MRLITWLLRQTRTIQSVAGNGVDGYPQQSPSQFIKLTALGSVAVGAAVAAYVSQPSTALSEAKEADSPASNPQQALSDWLDMHDSDLSGISIQVCI